MLIADMRHYLGDDLSLIELHAEATRLRDYLGSIIAVVTLRNSYETDSETPIRCRRRPGHKRCKGNIIAYFDETEPSAIKWGCYFCGDSGYISGWEGTFWYKRRSR